MTDVAIPASKWHQVNADLETAQEELVKLRADLAKANEENQEHRALFELQWSRMGQATDLWRQEDPVGRANVLPDLGDLLGWLVVRGDELRNTRDQLEAVVGEARSATRRLTSRLIASAHLLEVPFTDAPTSPWELVKADLGRLRDVLEMDGTRDVLEMDGGRNVNGVCLACGCGPGHHLPGCLHACGAERPVP